MKHRTLEQLEDGLEFIRRSPQDQGLLELIVRRPRTGERESLEQGELDRTEGLIGDNWRTRGCPRTENRTAHPDRQLNIMNSRVISLLAPDKERWQLAGDQLFIDMDLSAANLPAGSQIALGSAVIEVTKEPHTGCKKFMARYGIDALKFVNSEVGKCLNLRGINAKVIKSGTVRVGDVARKI